MQQVFVDVAAMFAERVLEKYGNRIDAIVLYGSVARGEARWFRRHDERSDIDLLVITDATPKIADGVLKIQVDLDLEHGTVTNVVLRSLAEVRRQARLGDPFIATILEEGVIQYDNGRFDGLRRSLARQGAAAPR